MSNQLPAEHWKNKKGTKDRTCPCRTWKEHWLNLTEEKWPDICSVQDCYKSATLGAHIYNIYVQGERIAPFCNSCNALNQAFNLKEGTILPSANKAKTCL